MSNDRRKSINELDILNQIKNAKQGIKEGTKTLIIDAAKDYYEDNINNYDQLEGMTYCIDIKTLTDENLEKLRKHSIEFLYNSLH